MLDQRITPTEFAAKYLGDYQVRGGEIIPDYCPFCHGGNGQGRRDRGTFALNAESGAYNCKRASCGVSGSFYQLLREFGEIDDAGPIITPARPATRPGARPKPARQYKTPKTKIGPLSEASATYLRLRGFSRQTWERRGVGEANGAIAMPYYERGKLVLVKFRPPRKPKPGERKGWREAGGKSVFWGMDLCDPSRGPLVITEGEMDTLALDEAGVANVVSVPSGNEDLTCVDICWDWLEQFKEIVIWPDNDGPGEKMAENLVKRLGADRCSIVRVERKDANEMLYLDGAGAVRKAVEQAQEIPIDGLIRVADIDDDFDPSVAEKYRTGFPGLDRFLVGGFYAGQLTIWSGVNSHGKSTLLGQVMLEAIEQGVGVCAFSGELPARVFRYWANLQAAGGAGAGYLATKTDADGNETYYVPKRIRETIQAWYRDKFYLYDSFGDADAESIIRVFSYAAKRHGCKVFLVDNLGATTFSGDERSFWHDQATFIRKMAKFAHTYSVHVHVVAHPRKVQDEYKDLGKEDIFGSGGISNIADNIITVRRLSPAEKDKEGADAKVNIVKNRLFGNHNKSLLLQFDPTSRRFWQESAGKTKEYGWLQLLPDDERRAAEQRGRLAESDSGQVKFDDNLPF